MLKRALTWLGLGGAAAAVAATTPPDPALYEPLFCDRPSLYAVAPGQAPAPWQLRLGGPDNTPAGVRAVAEDVNMDSRVRALAYAWLRERQHPVPAGEVLGVVIEVEVAGGLDVLAVYADGHVRYLNHGGRAVVLDALTPALREAWHTLMAAVPAASATARPWPRRGAGVPGAAEVRLAFVRSDGLHKREGRFDALQREPATGPLLLGASQLLAHTVQAVK